MAWETLCRKPNSVFLGEAGCGKSELAVHLALELAAQGHEVHFFVIRAAGWIGLAIAAFFVLLALVRAFFAAADARRAQKEANRAENERLAQEAARAAEEPAPAPADIPAAAAPVPEPPAEAPAPEAQAEQPEPEKISLQ